MSKSKARFEDACLERDEGDLDLRRERRGGRGGGGGGGGDGEGGLRLEDAVLLLGILKPPPPLSLPLHLSLSLSLPEGQEAALNRDKKRDAQMGDNIGQNTANDAHATEHSQKTKEVKCIYWFKSVV